MDQFVVLATVSDTMVADLICGALEGAGIPVLLEHVEIYDGKLNASGVRILAPSTKAQKAIMLLESTLSAERRAHQREALLH